MALSTPFVGAIVQPTTNNPASIAITYPVTAATASRRYGYIAVVAVKPDTATITTPAGWELLGSFAGGAGSSGVDAGPTELNVYKRTDETTATVSGSVTFTLTSASVSWGQMFRFECLTTEAFDFAITGGVDSTTGTAYSAVTSSVVADWLKTGDYVLVATSFPTDTLPTWGTPTLTSQGGTGSIALGTVTQHSAATTTGGNDAGGRIVGAVPTVTGSLSAGTLTWAATLSGTTTNAAGPSAVLRARAGTPAPSFSGGLSVGGSGGMSAAGSPNIARTLGVGGAGAVTTAGTPAVSGGLSVGGSGGMSVIGKPGFIGTSGAAPRMLDFTTMPANVRTPGGLGVETGGTNPDNTRLGGVNIASGTLSSDGADEWWFVDDAAWTQGTDLDVTYDLVVNPGGDQSRDISNFAFWLNGNAPGNPGADPALWNGYALRLQTGSGDGGFYRINNGGHTQHGAQLWTAGLLSGGGSAGQLLAGEWYRVRIWWDAPSERVYAEVRRRSDNVLAVSGFAEMGAAGSDWQTDTFHPRSGYFGQKRDGAQSTWGHRYDNLTLAGAAPTAGLTLGGVGGCSFVGAAVTAYFGTLGVGGAGALGLAGKPAAAGGLSVAATGVLTVSGAPAVARPLAVSGAGAVGFTGAPAVARPLAVGGTGAATFTATNPGARGALGVSGAGSSGFVASSPAFARPLAVGGTGLAAFAVTALTTTGQLAVGGAGELASTGAPAATGGLTVGGAGDLDVGGLPSVPTSLDVGSTGTVTFAAVPSVAASLAVGAAGALTFARAVSVSGTLAVSGTGSSAYAGTARPTSALGVGGTGTLGLTQRPGVSGVLAVAGDGNLSLASATSGSSTLDLGGHGQVTASGTPRQAAGLAVAAAGGITFTGLPKVARALGVGGSGAVTFAAVPRQAAGLQLAGAGELALTSATAGAGALEVAGAGVATFAATPGGVGRLDVAGAGASTYAGKPGAVAGLAVQGWTSLRFPRTAPPGGMDPMGPNTGVPSFVVGLDLGGSGALSTAAVAATGGSLDVAGAGELGLTGFGRERDHYPGARSPVGTIGRTGARGTVRAGTGGRILGTGGSAAIKYRYGGGVRRRT